MRPAIRAVQLLYAKRACRNVLAAAIADVVLDNNGAELCTHDCAGRTRVNTSSVNAMLAHNAEHQPRDTGCGRSLDECHVSPGLRAEVDRVVITQTSQRRAGGGWVSRRLVPLLACHLARFAANA